jgi:hypothetical protein
LAAARPLKLNWESSRSPTDAAQSHHVPASTGVIAAGPLAVSPALGVRQLAALHSPIPSSPSNHNIRAISSPMLNTTPRSSHAQSPPLTSRTPRNVAILINANASDLTSKSRQPLQLLTPASQRAPQSTAVDASARDVRRQHAAAATPPPPTSAVCDTSPSAGHHDAGAAGLPPSSAQDDGGDSGGKKRKKREMVAVQLQDVNAAVDLPEVKESVQPQHKQLSPKPPPPPPQQQHEPSSPPSSSCMPVWLSMSRTLSPPPPAPLPPAPFPNKNLHKLQARPLSALRQPASLTLPSLIHARSSLPPPTLDPSHVPPFAAHTCQRCAPAFHHQPRHLLHGAAADASSGKCRSEFR